MRLKMKLKVDMNKMDKQKLKDAIVNSIYNQYRFYGGYFDVKIVNLKKSDIDGVFYFDTILKFEDGSERNNDCEISIEEATKLINQ